MLNLKNMEILLKKCFYFVFSVFPLGIALCMGGKHFLFGTYEELKGTDTLYNWPVLCAFIVVLCFAGIFVIYAKRWNKKLFDNINVKKLSVVILITALIIRIAFFVVFRTALIPYSDGNHVWMVAHTNDAVYLNLKAIQNGWNNFMAIVVLLVRMFNTPYPVFILAQFVADGFVAFAVFKLAYEISDSKDIAFWAGLFYAVNPSALMRMFYFSPECYSMLCLALAAYTFVVVMKAETDKKMYMYALLTGVLLGIGNSLKSISLIFIVAVFIVITLRIMSGRISKQQVISWAMIFIVMAVPALGINKAALKMTTEIIGVEARDLLLYHQLNVGLNPYGRGDTVEENAWYYTNHVLGGTDPEEAKELLFDKLKNDWAEREIKIAPWLWDKVGYAWTGSTAEFTMLMQSSIAGEHNTVQHFVYVILLNFATSLMQLAYIFMMLLSAIGVLTVAFRQVKNDGAMLISLYVFGFSLLMLIIECQPRYKANIISFICVLAAVGLYEMLKIVTVKKKNTEKTEVDFQAAQNL